MGHTAISVAMCTFNGARYLREQLESLAAQTLPPAELVVCDDGSSDETWRILESFRREAKFEVRLAANKERLGAARNFEQAIRLSSGDIIFLADQDDIWRPRKIEIVVDTLERHSGASYAFSDAEVIDERGDSVGAGLWEMKSYPGQRLETLFAAGQVELLLRQNIVTGCAMAFRADFKNLILPIPDTWIHDYWIALLGSLFGCGVPIPERLLRYRKHASQQVGVGWPTLSARLRESFQARVGDYRRRYLALRDLQDRVRSISQTRPCSGRYMEYIDQKAQHWNIRASSQEARGLRKVNLVLEEWRSGRYKRFSGSWRSVVRDLCPQTLLR
jgi:glycosyltransferase involved in cell wall biosynthesis